MIHVLGSALIVAAAVLAVACAVFYGGWFRWWRSVEGRHLFAFMAVIGGSLALWAVFLLTSGMAWDEVDAGPREYARLTFAPIDWVLGQRLLLLIRAKSRELSRRKEASR